MHSLLQDGPVLDKGVTFLRQEKNCVLPSAASCSRVPQREGVRENGRRGGGEEDGPLLGRNHLATDGAEHGVSDHGGELWGERCLGGNPGAALVLLLRDQEVLEAGQ